MDKEREKKKDFTVQDSVDCVFVFITWAWQNVYNSFGNASFHWQLSKLQGCQWSDL